ncbi:MULTISPECIES: Arc family DNA-binding protein [unclassified Sinorhizobium]|uniref:Arc family DNA-binding protein n=1 Tax=unclassified Sinorhizobium TaxID=2613772 RepID=UPI0024C35159|nr:MULTISPECIES: Arc family DNA-binding protein [unclassified Sinorhizobium]MDK1377121.1 Arc family DNA-binding protein [Sinorhizobium sp. 6-70]MDK1479584.1 Arc family DNA-binding protein [Sinorhizobium sp. 6-117]
MAGKPGRGSDQFPLRLPDGMRDQLKEEADKNNRSMNAEIVARLEGYDIIHWRMGQLMEEKERLTAQLDATREALIEQKTISARLQHLLSENFEDAKRREDNDREAAEAIEARFNEMKAQSEYLESLKAELLELSKERDDINSEAEDLIKQQGEAIEMLMKGQRATAAVLKEIAKRQEPDITGTPLTPDLFDKLFNQLVRLEQKLDEKPKK